MATYSSFDGEKHLVSNLKEKVYNPLKPIVNSWDFNVSMNLSAIERAKIDCAEKLFNSISTANVKYHKVEAYQDLVDGMNAIS